MSGGSWNYFYMRVEDTAHELSAHLTSYAQRLVHTYSSAQRRYTTSNGSTLATTLPLSLVPSTWGQA